jgi:hypothetical protein
VQRSGLSLHYASEEVAMCKQNSCVSFDWKLEDYPPEGPGVAPKAAIQVLRPVEMPDGTPFDGDAPDDAEALRRAFAKQMQRTQEKECGDDERCVCVRQIDAKGVEKRFVVKVTTVYFNSGTRKIFRVNGTVRILKTEYAGECFDNALFARLDERDFWEVNFGDLPATPPVDLPLG